jgi:hypothetical protein
MKRPRRSKARRQTTAELRVELEQLVAQAKALIAAAAAQLHAAQALRQELAAEADASRHMPLLWLLDQGGPVH